MTTLEKTSVRIRPPRPEQTDIEDAASSAPSTSMPALPAREPNAQANVPASSGPTYEIELPLSRTTKSGVAALRFKRMSAGVFMRVVALADSDSIGMTEAFIAACADRKLTAEEVGLLPHADALGVGAVMKALLEDAKASGGSYDADNRIYAMSRPLLTNMFSISAISFKDDTEVTNRDSLPFQNAEGAFVDTREFIRIWGRIVGNEAIPLTSNFIEQFDAADFMAIRDQAQGKITGKATSWRRL